MKKSLRSLVLIAGIASATALGSNFALADDTGATPAATQKGEHGRQHGPDCRPGKHQRGQHFLQKLTKKLSLTEQQSTQVKALFQENRAQAKPAFTSLLSEKRALHKLVQSGSADEAAIRAQSAKVASLEADLAVQRAKGARQLMTLLTPEQQTKLKTLQAQREQKFDKFRGHEAEPRD